MSALKLHYKVIGEGQPIIILHGLFGSYDNWQNIANKLQTSFKVYLVDLRNHGLSPHSSIHNYSAMAEDVKLFIGNENLKDAIIIGHSMGGKTAMKLAVTNPELLNKLVVVDIAPKYYPKHHQQIFEAFESVKIESITSRQEADDQMSSVIKEMGVRQFLQKNLVRNENGKFEWRINLETLKNEIENIGEALQDSEKFKGETLFVGGELSNYVTNNDKELLHHHFPNSKLATIKGAGHWIQAEKPEEFLEVLQDFIG